MVTLRTPGAYGAEAGAGPCAIEPADGSVAAFVGYTERAGEPGRSLHLKPQRIESLQGFERHFGAAAGQRFQIGNGPQGALELRNRAVHWRLYLGLRLFFLNGGGPCWVVSVGGYDEAPQAEALRAGLAALEGEPEPALLVVPDAVLLPARAMRAVHDALLALCAEPQWPRFALLDLPGGDRAPGGADDPVAAFRQGLGVHGRGFGAAYYPDLDTSVLDEAEVDWRQVDADALGALAARVRADAACPPAVRAQLTGPDIDWADLHPTLLALSPAYRSLMQALRRQMNRLAPSAALAGVYAQVDGARGVWKAPANVALAAVMAPVVAISNAQQQDLNLSPTGISVNALRSFVGEGVLVWGARTLDGNSLDGRYVNVRRTLTMIERSARQAMQALAFERNDAATWALLKAQWGDFLTRLWRLGGLAGARPEEAFAVHCGLGETLTEQDLRDGVLRVSLLVAPSRPAEFIEITLEQRMAAA